MKRNENPAIEDLNARAILGFKTPEPQRRHARNYWRRKKGIPEDAPIGTRAEPFNRKRRGTGNREGRVSMLPKAWKALDRMKGKQSRGEFISTLIMEAEIRWIERGDLK